ncbi:prion-inhibition and propagation-domain-containing protein [Xylariaceae sp. FL1272]|nr:prion-inhibition and propagation-domain-containing protein [Xylariaceae sp. FL1272]
MAEILGTVASVVTLVGLLKSCIDACELIRAAKDYREELERCDLKLTLEQCRLKTWGKSMGLIKDEGSQQGRNLLEHFEFRPVVETALRQIINLLTNTHLLSKKYGAQPLSTELTLPSPHPDSWRSSSAFRLTMAFKRLKIHEVIRDQTNEVMRSSVWVLYDQKKYSLLIGELRTLVDAVENVTRDLVTREQQQQFFVSRINAISDVKTLNMLTEVCEVDHPAFSDAASVRAEVLSSTTTHKADLGDWIDGATNDPNSSQREVTEEMESWDLADFRRQYLALLNVQASRLRTTTNTEGVSPDQTDQAVTKSTASTNDTPSQKIFSEDDLERGGVVEFGQAIAYVNKIKQRFRFSRRPEVYGQFLETLQTYQREQRSIQDVYGKIMDLFRSEPDLIEDFKIFLPENRVQRPQSPLNQDITKGVAGLSSLRAIESINTTGSEDRYTHVFETPPQEHENPGPVLDNALRYLDLVQVHFKDAPIFYHSFLQIMKDFKDNILDTLGVVLRVETLFAGHEELLRGFKTFMPPEYKINDSRVEASAQRPIDGRTGSSFYDSSLAVSTILPATAPLSEITRGFDMNNVETLRLYTEIALYYYSERRDTLVFSPQLEFESWNTVAKIAERFGLSCDYNFPENKAAQVLVGRSHQNFDNDDGNNDSDDATTDDDSSVVASTIEEDMEMTGLHEK